MGSLSIWHWLIVLAVVLLLFGGSSKISTLMGDFAKGIKSFKKNMGEDESMEHGHGGSLGAPGPTASAVPPPQVVAPTAQPAYQPQASYPPTASTQEPARHQN